MFYLGIKKIHRSSTVISHFNYVMNTNTREGKCALISMTFDYIACEDQLDHAWIPGKRI